MLRLLLLAAGALSLALLLPLPFAAPTALAAAHTPATGHAPAGSRPPGGNIADPVVRAVDIAQPAIVRIGTEELATLSLQLCSRAITLPLNGSPYQLGLLGSGAFISAHGDILTADHVVDVPDFEVAVFAAQDIADVLDNQTSFDHSCPGDLHVSAGDVASGFVNFNFTAHVSNVRTLVWLSTGFSGPLAAGAIRDVPRQDATKTVASSYNDDDLAIIHVNMEDTPSVRFDDSTAVAVQDQLTVIGFPGNGDVNNDATNFLTPSVNQVMVNAIKTADNGSALIQVGGNVEHGDSGAPVLDSAGHIVGVVSFGSIADPLGDTTFLRTSDSALSLIRGQRIDLMPGAFEQLWTSAFTDYAATTPGHWAAAARKLELLAARYPQFQALTPYLSYARSAATAEAPSAPTVQSRPLPPAMLLTILGVLVLLALVLAIGIWLLVRSLRRPAPAPAFVAPGTPPMLYPAQRDPATMVPPPPWLAYPTPPYASGGMPPGATDVATPPTAAALLAPGYGVAAPATIPLAGARTLQQTAGPAADPSLAPPVMQAGSGMPAHLGQPVNDLVLCANGHVMARTAAFCPWCGAPAARTIGEQTPPAGPPASQ